MKTIPGFPMYKVTKDGKVWSIKNNRFLKSCANSSGYPLVSLFKNDSKQHSCHVHRLVLEAYVGPCPEGMEACHYDGSRSNNNLDNLRWDTRSSNQLDVTRHGNRLGEDNHQSKLTIPKVRLIIYQYRAGLFNMQELATAYSVSKQLIWQILHKKAWKHIWTD